MGDSGVRSGRIWAEIEAGVDEYEKELGYWEGGGTMVVRYLVGWRVGEDDCSLSNHM